PQGKSPVIAIPKVTAGLRWAGDKKPDKNTAIVTARPHPKVISTQPEFSDFVFFKTSAATTPSPNNTNTKVPINSPSICCANVVSINNNSLYSIVILIF